MKPHIFRHSGKWWVSRYRGDIFACPGDTIANAWKLAIALGVRENYRSAYVALKAGIATARKES